MSESESTPRLDVLTCGEVMLALRASGPLFADSSVTTSVAGAEANVAIGLARLGHRVAWAGRVGPDEAGAAVVRTLRGEGVEVAATVDTAPTGMMVRRERVPGVTTVDYHRTGSAGSRLEGTDVVTLLQERRPTYLHVTGVTPALSAQAREATVSAVKAARDWGVKVSLDVNFRSRLWTAAEAAEVMAPLAARSDVLVASEDELALVAGSVPELFGSGVGLVAIKRGAEGAVVHTADGGVIEMPAIAVRAVDPVGAGDAFCSGLLSGLLEGLDTVSSLERAVRSGAFSVVTPGDWEGLPRRDELALLDIAAGGVIR